MIKLKLEIKRSDEGTEDEYISVTCYSFPIGKVCSTKRPARYTCDWVDNDQSHEGFMSVPIFGNAKRAPLNSVPPPCAEPSLHKSAEDALQTLIRNFIRYLDGLGIPAEIDEAWPPWKKT